jgi:hypothetical protein
MDNKDVQSDDSSENDDDIEETKAKEDDVISESSDDMVQGEFINPLAQDDEKDYSSDEDRYITKVKEPKEKGSKRTTNLGKRNKATDNEL